MSFSKIVLKSTTKISLNDRFTGLRYENPSPNNGGTTSKEHRQAIQASRKNQRLAVQMENRPAVLAALKKEKFQYIHHRLNGQQTVPVKQRLAVASRLSLPESKRSDLRTRGFQVRGRGRGLSRSFQNSNDRGFRGRDRFRGIGARIGQNFVPGRERGVAFRGGRGRGVGRSRGRGPARGFRINT